MGDYADMVLEGLLDEETGEYIGDHNEAKHGTAAPGFPVSLEREAREARKSVSRKVACDVCGKRVKPMGLQMHKRDVHDQ